MTQPFSRRYEFDQPLDDALNAAGVSLPADCDCITSVHSRVPRLGRVNAVLGSEFYTIDGRKMNPASRARAGAVLIRRDIAQKGSTAGISRLMPGQGGRPAQ